MSEVNIFISFRDEDRELAGEVKTLLEGLVEGVIVCFVSSLDIKAGIEWLRKLHSELEKADYLVLLYTGPAENWNWPFYEVGLFQDIQRTKKDPSQNDNGGAIDKLDDDVFTNSKSFCLMPANLEIPGPLQTQQNVPVAVEDNTKLGELLKDLIVRDDPIRDLWYQQNINSVNETTLSIAKAVLARHRNKSYVGEVVVAKVPELIEQDGKYSLPENTVFTSPTANTLSGLFDLQNNEPGKVTLGELRSQSWLQAGWLESLKEVATMRMKTKGRISPNLLSHQIDATRPSYKPTLYMMEQFEDGSHEYSMVFQDNSKDSRPFTSFSELMAELNYLIDSIGDRRVQFMAYTPALGFLAQSDSEWNAFKERLLKLVEKGRIQIACLQQDLLAEWQGMFDEKPTERTSIGVDNKIDANAIEQANEFCMKFMDDIDPNFLYKKRWEELPNFYLFTGKDMAIFAVPFGLPSLDPSSKNEDVRNFPVEMVGLASGSSEIVLMAEAMFNRYTRQQDD